MKAIIVYYSMSGNVKQTAERIAAATGADLLALHPVKAYPDKGAKKYLWGGKSAVMGEKPKLQPYLFNAERYDTVILGSPVWASNITPPLRTFLAEHGEELEGKRIAAFLCSMGGGDAKAFAKLKKALGVEELAAELPLIQPKEKPGDEVDSRISVFCRALRENDDQD